MCVRVFAQLSFIRWFIERNEMAFVLFNLCVDFAFVLFSQFLLKSKHLIILWRLWVCMRLGLRAFDCYFSFFFHIYVFHRNTIDAL